jgi:hypothetical protein
MNLLIAATCFVLDAPPPPAPSRVPEVVVRQILPDTEEIGSALVSRDGSRVAFTRTISGTTEIFLANADGSELHGITSFGDFGSLSLESISANGSAVAFTKSVRGVQQIFVATADGALRQLTTANVASTQPRMNGAADRIYFRRPNGVYTMSGLGAEVRQLSTLPATLGQTGDAGDRIGGRFTGRLNRQNMDVLVDFEWSGSSRFLSLPAQSGPPLLAPSELQFVVPFGAGDVWTEFVNGGYAGPLFFIEWPVTRLVGVRPDVSRTIVEADGRIVEGSLYDPSWTVFDPGFPVGGASASDDLGVIACSRVSGSGRLGLWVLDQREPAIHIDAPTRMWTGGQTDVWFNSPDDPGKRYVAAASFGRSPGTALADGRVVPLNSDRLAAFSASPDNGVFVGFRGRLDSAGAALGEVRLPADWRLSGRVIWLAFVVWDPEAPGRVVRISRAIDSTIWTNGCFPGGGPR